MTTSKISVITGKSECKDAVQRIIESANLHIAIYTQQLEPILYSHQHICDAISRLARKNKHTKIRIIALHSQSISANGHCLINLSQRLSSSIQIRVPVTEELKRFSESWLIADDHSMCQINNPGRYEGSLIQNEKTHVRTKLEAFDHAWENSQNDVNTRSLHL